MSVNSKMTAIADKIRGLLGLTGTMGLDAMATNLGTEQTNINNAFSAVNSKGGTVPFSKVSGNLATAINSIPLGVTVQRKAGSFTANVTNGGKTLEATVNCGFVPDVVLLKGKAYTEENTTYYYDMAAVFSERSADKNYLVSGTNNSYTVLEGRINQAANGFKITFWGYDDAWGEKTMVAERMEYVAIKYT